MNGEESMQRVWSVLSALSMMVAGGHLSAQSAPVTRGWRVDPALMVGAEQSTLKGKDASSDLDWLRTPTAGVSIMLHKDAPLGLDIGVRYSERGFVSPGQNASFTYRSRWIAIPVLARLTRTHGTWRPLALAGVEVATRFGCAVDQTPRANTTLDCDAVSRLIPMSSSATNLVLGGGIERPVRHLMVGASARYVRGLTNATTGAGGTNHYESVGMQMEIRKKR